MTEFETPQIPPSRQRPASRREPWKSEVAIGGVVVTAPVIAVVMLLLASSMLPALIVGIPLLAAFWPRMLDWPSRLAPAPLGLQLQPVTVSA
jgi:hypothetical protein